MKEHIHILIFKLMGHCSYLLTILFLSAANVHFLRAKLQVHISQRAAHDQLHAENPNGDVRPGHTGLLSARLHLHPTAGHPPQKRHDHEEEGWLIYRGETTAATLLLFIFEFKKRSYK